MFTWLKKLFAPKYTEIKLELPEETILQLDAECLKLNITRDKLIEAMLKAFIKRYEAGEFKETPNKETIEAIEEARGPLMAKSAENYEEFKKLMEE